MVARDSVGWDWRYLGFPTKRAVFVRLDRVLYAMSEFTCACDDVLMVTCSTGPDTAAYVALALVIVSIAMMRMCTCDWGDDDDDSSDDESSDGVRSMFS